MENTAFYEQGKEEMISVAIFTCDEEVNLPHCLASLSSCDDVVVVDSQSKDKTREMALAGGARVFEHVFTGFGDQRQWAMENIPFKNPWLLILDADERMTPELWHEMKEKVSAASENVAAFRLKRRFFWEGKWLRHANLYPSWVVRLVRLGKVRYFNRGHAETQEVEGKISFLEEDLVDENHKGLEAWRARQVRYAEEEAKMEAFESDDFLWSECLSSDPLRRQYEWKRLARRMPASLRGALYFAYAYGWRLGFLDGCLGLRFCMEKARFQGRIARRATEMRLKKKVVNS